MMSEMGIVIEHVSRCVCLCLSELGRLPNMYVHTLVLHVPLFRWVVPCHLVGLYVKSIAPFVPALCQTVRLSPPLLLVLPN